LNFRYVQADGRAFWVADPVRRLPEPIRGAMPFSRTAEVVASSATRRGYVSDAGAPRFPLPTAEISRNGTDITLALHGSQATDAMTLMVPGDAGISRIAMNGKLIPVESAARSLMINCASPGCRDATLTLTQKRIAPFTAQLSELRYGLPPGGEMLLKARGTLGTPSQQGDSVELIAKLRID